MTFLKCKQYTQWNFYLHWDQMILTTIYEILIMLILSQSKRKEEKNGFVTSHMKVVPFEEEKRLPIFW